jgi:HEAT repeat protein
VLAGRRLATRPGALARKLHDALLTLRGCAADQADAALILMEHPGPPRAAGATALQRIARSAGLPPHRRLTVAQALATHDDPSGQSCAHQVFTELSTDDGIHPWLRYRAVAGLGRLDPRRTVAAAGRLRTTLTDPTADPEHRRWAAEALGELSDGLRREARDALMHLANATPDDRARRRNRRSAALVDGTGVTRPA